MANIKGVKVSPRIELEYYRWIDKYRKAINKALKDSIDLKMFSDEPNETTDTKKKADSTDKQIENFNGKVAKINRKVPALTGIMSAKLYKYFNLHFERNSIKASFGVDVSHLYAGDRKLLNLLKSNSEDYILKYGNEKASWLRTSIRDNYANGGSYSNLVGEIEGRFKVDTNRAKLIARNESSGFVGALERKRATDLGLRFYIWRTSGDERVRGNPSGKYPNAKPSHWKMEGKYCRWDDASVYADTLEDAQDGIWKSRADIGGVEAHPKETINCRCNAEFVVE